MVFVEMFLVKWFSIRTGYGFIRRGDTEADIFVHASSIVRSYTRLPLILTEDQMVWIRCSPIGINCVLFYVEFDVVKGPKGLEATCVSGPNGKAIGFVARMANMERTFPRKVGFDARMSNMERTLPRKVIAIEVEAANNVTDKPPAKVSVVFECFGVQKIKPQ